MMRILFFALAISSLLIACQTNNSQTTQQKDSTSIAQVVKIADFEKSAENLLEKEVVVTGTVSHVCKHGGKRMFVFEAPTDSITMEIKTKESFKPEFEGNDFIITGIVKEERITEADIAKMEEEAKAETEKHEDKEKNHHHASGDKAQVLRDMLKKSGKDHLSFYFLDCTKLEPIKK